MTPRTIKINPKHTHNQFGCNKDVFEQHVKGKDLKVIDFKGGFYEVLVEDEAYTVCKSDVAFINH